MQWTQGGLRFVLRICFECEKQERREYPRLSVDVINLYPFAHEIPTYQLHFVEHLSFVAMSGRRPNERLPQTPYFPTSPI